MVDIKGRVDQAIKHAKSLVEIKSKKEEIGEEEYRNLRDSYNKAVYSTFGDLSSDDIKKFQSQLYTNNVYTDEISAEQYNEAISLILELLDECVQTLGVDISGGHVI